MTTKSKTFDCVEMKNRIQADIQTDYEARQAEFPSFIAFVKHAAARSDYARAMRRKFAKQGALPTAVPPRRAEP